MRRSLVRFSTPIGKHAAAFSSGAGRGRGRGGGVDPHYNLVRPVPGEPVDNSNVGHGRGETRVSGEAMEFGRKVPEFIQRMEEEEESLGDDIVVNKGKASESDVRVGLMDVLGGAGRGSIGAAAGGGPGIGARQLQQQENRFVRARQENVKANNNINNVSVRKTKTTPFSNPEDARNNAMGILSRGDGTGTGTGTGDGGERVMESGGRGGGRGGRGGRGRGGRGFRGRGGRGGRFGGRGDRREEEEDDDDDDACFIGDPADGEKLAQKLGPETMNMLAEGFEEMSQTVLPSPDQDAFIEAMHINYSIECEPEYLFGDFESNPDIDEKPSMSLRECFEKAKPFLMAYENIQSHEEWEEAVEDAMKQVPLMKQIVDYYSGPDRVTAKRQMEELERVAETLPKNVPDSVKRFTNRAVLSLQSNPGWGFDKKCQFMDKLVREVSQQYK